MEPLVPIFVQYSRVADKNANTSSLLEPVNFGTSSCLYSSLKAYSLQSFFQYYIQPIGSFSVDNGGDGMDSNPQRFRAPVFKTGPFPIRIISVNANDWNRTNFLPSSAARVDHNHYIGMARRPRFERGRSVLETERLPLPHRRMCFVGAMPCIARWMNGAHEPICTAA